MDVSTVRRGIRGALLAFAVAAAVWGALAFGAVYPWAFLPLAIACASVGVVALVVGWHRPPALSALGLALAAVALSIAVQLVPLSRTALDRVSPNTEAFIRSYSLSYGVLAAADDTQNVGGRRQDPLRHPISIAPDRTTLGLCLFTAFALFLLGSVRVVSACGADPLVSALVGFGILLAFFGIVQAAVWAPNPPELIYGFWRPQFQSRPFGPFVNPNHFAGWMLMAIPLALAAFYDALLRVLASSRRDGRRRAFFGSPDAGRMLVFAIGAGVMGLALVMTRSRSGVGAFVGGSALAAWAVGRRQATGRGRALVAVACLLLLAGTLAWAGSQTVTGKFIEAGRSGQGVSSLGGRLEIWRDTLEIVRRFPAAGTGFNTYGVAMMIYQTRNLEVHFREAHNDYLQLAAEGGALVGIPIVVALGIFVRDVRRRFREAPAEGSTYWLRIGAVVGMVSVSMQSLVEFSLQMPGNAVMFALLAAIALNRSPRLRDLSPE